MPLLGRIFAGDEELGKKDDDHKFRKGHVPPLSRTFRHSVPAIRRRRLVYGVVFLLLLYILFQHVLPDLGFHPQRRGSRGSDKDQAVSYEAAPTGQPPRSRASLKVEEHYYGGRIKFYNLAGSLRGVMGLGRHNRINRHVIFVASNLKSASNIIPLACEMASWRRNNVHFALMGRDDLSISEIKDLNGISDEYCAITWHDARPDYPRWSSDVRMEASVASAIGHIHTYIEPQAIITDHASREDGFFIKAVRTKAVEIGKSLIELPLDATENLMWLTHLDSGSLAAWQTVYVDLVIHAPLKSSGSLIRLLKSIEAADYFGSRRPHLTIELPAEIDRPTLDFLENLVWPPLDWSGGPHVSQVTLRHRLPRNRFTAEETSTHFIESFYPARPRDSHVLLVSPQVELSPIYYHYVMYNLLHHKYATSIRVTDASKNLMGFSLELPLMYLNNSAELEPPRLESASEEGAEFIIKERMPFLWQAPNSNAALYFGDKWVELHSFLSARMSRRDPNLASDYSPPKRQKIVSEYYPSWMEYVQELMRTRGYSLLYPYFPTKSDALVTIHKELFQLPEEYSPTRHQSSTDPIPSVDPHDPFVIDPSANTPGFTTREESSLLTSNLVSLLPEPGHSNIHELVSLPILSHEGNLISPSFSASNARTFANDFRREIGRCSGTEPVIYNHMSAGDLFCNPDQSAGFLKDPPEEKDENNNEERIHSSIVVGSPLEFPPDQVESKARTLADEDEDLRNGFAAHLARQNSKLAADADKSTKLEDNKLEAHVLRLNSESRDDMTGGSSKADAKPAIDENFEGATANPRKIESKDEALKINEEIIRKNKLDPLDDLEHRDPQAVLDSTTPVSPSLSITSQAESSHSQAEFVPPVAIRHPGW